MSPEKTRSMAIELWRMKENLERIHAYTVSISQGDNTLSTMTREMINRIGDLSALVEEVRNA